jgi:hypothetical protein
MPGRAKHGPWLNQVEVYFSVVQRKALRPDDFADLDAVAARLLAFQKHYNTTRPPLRLDLYRDDLNQLLHRLGPQDLHAPRPIAA